MIRFTRHYSVATHFPIALTVVYGKYVESIHAKRFYLWKKPCTNGKSVELKVSEPIFSLFLFLLVCHAGNTVLCRVCNLWDWMKSWDVTIRVTPLHKKFHIALFCFRFNRQNTFWRPGAYIQRKETEENILIGVWYVLASFQCNKHLYMYVVW